MNNVLMLLQSEFPPDIRLEKEIIALAGDGYNVTLFCNQYEKDKTENFEYCEIVRLKALTKNKKLNKILNFPAIFNLRILVRALVTLGKAKPVLIHVHDLPMLPFGVVLKFYSRRPLIFDMHENYPAALKSYKKTSLIERIFKNYKIAQLFENFLINFVDAVIVVTEENKTRLINKGIPENKIRLVSNTVDLSQFPKTNSLPEQSTKYEKNFVLIYSGRVSFNRGLDTAVEALQFLKSSVPNIKLLIVGEGSHLPKLKRLADSLKVNEFVSFLPWPGHEKIKEYISMADVCLIPQPSNEHADTTVPHKLFEYMSQAKPILTSDAKPLKRIIEETKAGKWFVSNNPEEFAKKVVELRDSLIDYGSNGRKAVEEKYNWENDKRELLYLYHELSGNN